jgi:hypothetical protein
VVSTVVSSVVGAAGTSGTVAVLAVVATTTGRGGLVGAGSPMAAMKATGATQNSGITTLPTIRSAFGTGFNRAHQLFCGGGTGRRGGGGGYGPRPGTIGGPVLVMPYNVSGARNDRRRMIGQPLTARSVRPHRSPPTLQCRRDRTWRYDPNQGIARVLWRTRRAQHVPDAADNTEVPRSMTEPTVALPQVEASPGEAAS